MRPMIHAVIVALVGFILVVAPLRGQDSEVGGIEFLPLRSATFDQLAFPSLAHALTLFREQRTGNPPPTLPA